MASSVAVVMQFLNELAQRAKPAAQHDLTELRAFAATLGIDDLKPWDTSYASEKLKQQKHNLSQETLRAYFPAPKVIAGLFDIVQKLYGIEITAKDVDVWAETCYLLRN
jgi:oligopeptidase A